MARSSVNDFIIDFGKEEEAGGGGGVRVKEGTYRVKIIAAKTGTSEDKGTPYLELSFRFLDGQYAKRKTKLTERLYVSPKAYSRFRLLMEALDLKPPAKLNLVKLIPKLKGGELYIQVEDDEREGYKTRSRVGFQGFVNPEDYDPDDEDADDEDEDDEDLEDEDDDDLEDEDEEDDEDEDEDEEEEEPAPKKRRKPAAKKRAPAKRRKKAAPVDDDEDEDEDEDDEDEDEDEEPAPRKRRAKKAAPAAAKKRSKRKPAKKDEDDEDDDDLDDLDLDEM